MNVQRTLIQNEVSDFDHVVGADKARKTALADTNWHSRRSTWYSGHEVLYRQPAGTCLVTLA